MPDLFPTDVPDKPVTTPDFKEAELIGKLFDYTEAPMNPWREHFLDILKKCYNFKELQQWDEVDRAALDEQGVPALAVDRINRGLDTIKGARLQRNNKRKISPKGTGDDRIAELLDRTARYCDEQGQFEDIRSQAFDAMLDCGIGFRKIGYDPTTGEVWADYVPTEDFGHSRTMTKDLRDISWCWQRSIMDWERAMLEFPQKAADIKSLRTILESTWEQEKENRSETVTTVTRDYGRSGTAEKTNSYPDQVEIHEFWKMRVIPSKVIGSMIEVPIQIPGTNMVVPTQQQQLREEPVDYEVVEGEQELDTKVRQEWWQYIVIGDRANHVLAREAKSKYSSHPYTGTCAERKKSGEPRGYIEPTIPHQIRINVSWAQMVARNNKALRIPLAVKNVVDIGKLVVSSAIGNIMSFKQTEELLAMNVQPQIDVQAIEEGNMARADMDFAAAATEPALRGQASPGDAASKVALQQQAAAVPQNKWTQADKDAELAFGRKLLEIIILEFPVEKIVRIVGPQVFQALLGPKVDELGNVIAPPIQLPLTIDIAHYDVTVQDEALSDFEKQQSFNAAMALHQSGFVMDDEYMILHAPIKDTQEALESHRRAKADIVRQLTAMIQGLQAENEQLTKMIPKEGSTNGKPKGGRSPGGQAANAVRGRQQPQVGRQSMPGGTSPRSPLGM